MTANTGTARHAKPADLGLRLLAMANIRIGLGVAASLDQEKELRKAAVSLPDGWSVDITSNPAVGFDVRVVGPGLALAKAFAPDGAPNAVRYLLAIARNAPERA